MEAELFKQNPWWEGQFKDNSIPRQDYLDKIMQSLDKKEILFVTGLRRIGKTTILKQAIAHLLTRANPKNILFLSLDSFNFHGKSIHELIETYREINKKSVKELVYLFLDEVTSKENFEQELKSLFDNDNVKLVCSSSIATLMHDKKAYLTGRTKTLEVMPLTFKEFLIFKKADISKADKAIMESYFKDYLRLGGIPQYVLTEDSEYLNELVQSILFKDIIAHHKITNEKMIKELFVLLCERVGKVISYNKLAKVLNTSVDSVKRYVGYFEKAYLFYVINRHSKSLNEKTTSPKKIYAGDIGIKNLVTGFKDLGACYENLVFLKIKNMNPRYYYENSVEIDFIAKDTLIESKYGQTIKDKQKEVFESLAVKNKILADSYTFFLS